jgi:hypothetical protein
VELEAEKEIRQKMLKDTAENQMIDGLEVEVNILGCFFPSSVIADPGIAPIPQLGPRCALTEQLYGRLFQGRSLLSIQMAVDTASLKVSAKTANEIAGRVRRYNATLPARGPTTEQEEIKIPENLDVLGRGPLNIPSPLEISTDDLNRHVSGIVARMYMDLLWTSPNPSDPVAKSHCRLSEDERRSVTIRQFQEPNLAVVWRRVLVLQDESAWKLAVSNLYPWKINENHPFQQHYKVSVFYKEWRTLMARVGYESRRELASVVNVSV